MRMRTYASVCALALTVPTCGYGAATITTAKFTQSTGKVQVSGTAPASTMVIVHNAITGDFLGSVNVGSKGTWSYAATLQDGAEPCAVVVEYDGVRTDAPILGASSGCRGVPTRSYDTAYAYAFDATNPTEVYDLVSGQVGVLQGAITTTPSAKFGAGALACSDGALVRFEHIPAHAIDYGLTIEGWVKPEGALTSWATMLMKEEAGDIGYALYGKGETAGQVWLSGNRYTGSATPGANKWSHVAATYDGAALRFYVNGVQKGSKAVNGPIVSDAPGPLTLCGNAVWGEYLRGVLDEVRVTAHALSPQELAARMLLPAGKVIDTFAYPVASYARSPMLRGSLTYDGTWSIAPAFAGQARQVMVGTGNPVRITSGRMVRWNVIEVASPVPVCLEVSDGVHLYTQCLEADIPATINLSAAEASTELELRGASSIGVLQVGYTYPELAAESVTASLAATPQTVVAAGFTTVTWASAGSTACTGTGFATDNQVAGSVTLSVTESTSFTVTCTGVGGSATASTQVEVTLPTDNIPPSSPEGASASGVSIDTIVATWNASTDDRPGVVTYEVYVDGVLVASTASTSYSVTGLMPNTEHSVYVVAKDGVGNASAPTQTATSRTYALATAGMSVTLAWDPSPSAQVTHTVTDYCIGGTVVSTGVELEQTCVGSGEVLTLAVQPLDLGVHRYYAVSKGIPLSGGDVESSQPSDSVYVEVVSAPVAVLFLPVSKPTAGMLTREYVATHDPYADVRRRMFWSTVHEAGTSLLT